jgi:thiamine biosynthesis lipoprotein
MPATNFDSVTVICEDSLLADYMATTLFILPPQQAMALAESMEGLEAIWVDTEGAITYTSGYPDYSKTY